MIVAKVYLYDSTQVNNGYKGTDFSRYVKMAYSNVDNLEDTLDTFELSLMGLPFREEFTPKTKFIIELYDESTNPDTGEIELSSWNENPFHLEVQSDTVEQPILSDSNYFNHNLSLIEASVDTQNRLVDNIAVTYKLQQVSLEEQPTYDLGLNAGSNLINTDSTTTRFEKEHQTFSNFTRRYMIQGHKFEWIIPDWYNVTIDGITTTPYGWWSNYYPKYYQEILQSQSSKTFSFPVPMLKCSSAMQRSYDYNKNGYCSIDCTITDTNLVTNEQTTRVIQIDPYGADTNESWTRDYFDIVSEYDRQGVFAPTEFGWIVSRWVAKSIQSDGYRGFVCYPCKVAQSSSSRENRVISIQVEPNHSYQFSFSLHNFNLQNSKGCGMHHDESLGGVRYYDWNVDNVPSYYSYATAKLGLTWDDESYAYYVNNGYPNATLNIQGVQASGEGKIVFSSAPPATAYDLFNKAQLCCQTFTKEPTIIVDETPKQVQLGDDDKQILKDTTIIECFYNQKNLWEILLDIGKYIHARPKLKFGKDNKYIVSWKKYGDTQKNQDLGSPISVYNSKFIEDYICSVSSYVTNMVQLGGTIREIVAPKSSSEDFLVYNDVAEIKTSKNIIQIDSLDVICNDPNSEFYGQRRNLTGKDPRISLVQVSGNGAVNSLNKQNTTGFVFEEGVYKLLDISPSTSVNKGYAIYYTLGTNTIKGLNYRLPTENTGDPLNDYAIKNIIGVAFGLPDYSQWRQIKVNNYLFDITYRTKDTLRADQTRPDLRHYLLSTPYDNVPQHNQFSNQTDVVIDSVKYGNNIYGKLIRTGNTIYTKTEWVSNLNSLKRSGQLYIIDGGWYYVSKVTNTFFSDHIISMVEFSKDFNKLSQIIGIPSEPRFYEISEQSLINREISINDYIVLGTEIIERDTYDKSFIQDKGMEYIAGIVLSPFNNIDNTSQQETPLNFPRYVVTTMKNDNDKVVLQNTEPLNIQLLTPASSYSLENSLTIEWDMLDNFSAGDRVIPLNRIGNSSDPVNSAYYALEAVRYCDKYGRADMFNFAILDDYDLSASQVQDLPINTIDVSNSGNRLLFGDQNSNFYNSSNPDTNKGIVVLKDNREKLSFNYNLQTLTDSDRFVLSAYFWQQGKKNLKLAILNKEVNKIANSTIEERDFAIKNIPFKYSVDNTNKTIQIYIKQAIEQGGVTQEELEQAQAIVIYSTDLVNESSSSSSKYFVMARNVSDLGLDDKSADWFVSPYSKSMFKKQ